MNMQKCGSYHTHSLYCDGNDSIRDMVDAATSQGMAALGMSSHAPCPEHNVPCLAAEAFPVYLDEIRTLGKEYTGTIKVYAAMECEYMDRSSILWGMEYQDRLDYVIGSVHSMYHDPASRPFSIDGPVEQFEALLHEKFSGRIQDFSAYYYELQKRMIKDFRFDFLGHCDLITKHNRNNKYFNPDEPWYRRQVDSMLETAALHNVRVEVNTGGVSRGYSTDFYPSAYMRKRCHDVGISMVVTSDAHAAKNVAFGFEQAFGCLKEAGYTCHDVFTDGQWESVEIG
ncbi:histidinol-phosphatase [Parasphaerochaeta coccoides]|uniref:Histidinol-phosphatase n=1 Tax=Parasphaerochaeta coccoides (strain ATCC BAA-1237 / DSM 17374 / SPN1) TaxID=760011 RepID=F4GKF0_PARC1|nr:histidinol-phosphatase [Parasphaerochaeta coccoides]AEC02833.1 histidinol phosphate phosphatase HisJ family [Parasphaerochaeta coccoides DSM 17374]